MQTTYSSGGQHSVRGNLSQLGNLPAGQYSVGGGGSRGAVDSWRQPFHGAVVSWRQPFSGAVDNWAALQWGSRQLRATFQWGSSQLWATFQWVSWGNPSQITVSHKWINNWLLSVLLDFDNSCAVLCREFLQFTGFQKLKAFFYTYEWGNIQGKGTYLLT